MSNRTLPLIDQWQRWASRAIDLAEQGRDNPSRVDQWSVSGATNLISIAQQQATQSAYHHAIMYARISLYHSSRGDSRYREVDGIYRQSLAMVRKHRLPDQ